MIDFTRYIYSTYQKIIEITNSKSSSCGEILMFHQINNDKSTWDYPGCSITSDSFAQMIDAIVKQGWVFRPISDIYKYRDANSRYITFDDAYSDVLENAIPVLLNYRIPFTVFIALDYLNEPNYLSTEMLQQLIQLPLCTIGAHTMSHQKLRQMNNGEAQQEIVKSREILAQMIGKPVDFFAYPYGSVYACSKENIQQVASSGYKMAFSTLNCNLSSIRMKNKWFLPRKNVNENNFMSFVRGGIEHA